MQAQSVHGSAAWSPDRALQDLGDARQRGVVLGTSSSFMASHNGPEHIVLSAPTRSGKGVGVVIPTLLVWPASVICTDMKAENWERTAGFRSKFTHCVYFNPTDPKSAAYNPLLDVRPGLLEVRDVQNIADILVDPDGDGYRDHWTETAHTLLVGAVLHVLYSGSRKSLRGVLDALTDPSYPDVEMFERMLVTIHDPLGERGWCAAADGRPTRTHPVVAAAAQMMLNKSPNERSGVLSTATRFLSLYLDEIVASNTDSSDFSALDLMEAEKPVSLYLVIPPSDLSRTRGLFRLVLNLICRRLTESLSPPGTRHRLLMLLDEFPAYGRLEFFESNLAFLAGYGIKCVLVIQSPHQLERYYGRNHSLLDNAHIRIFFTPNDPATCELVSRMLGTTTVVQKHRNFSGNRFAAWLGHESVVQHEIGRPLMTPGEVSVMPDDECIVFVGGQSPFRLKKLRYYEHRGFTERLLPPPELSASGYAHGLPPRENPWADFVPRSAEGQSGESYVGDDGQSVCGEFPQGESGAGLGDSASRKAMPVGPHVDRDTLVDDDRSHGSEADFGHARGGHSF